MLKSDLLQKYYYIYIEYCPNLEKKLWETVYYCILHILLLYF